MEEYDVVIATPAVSFTAPYVRSLANTIKVLDSEKISWKFLNYESSCYIRDARERIMNDSMERNIYSQVPFSGKFNYKKIMWIDSDIEWNPHQFLSLYYSEREIITGAYMMTDGRIAVSFNERESPFPHQIPTSREVEVLSCGFGFICIKNGVFEKMPQPWFDSLIFEVEGRLVTGVGEDSAWCSRAREAGFKIWLDPNIRVTHHKTVPLFWA